MFEENLRRAMTISHGSPAVFFTRPLSLTLLIAAFLLLVITMVPAINKSREKIF
jgi:putative tricarboxylic transport membrane protein